MKYTLVEILFDEEEDDFDTRDRKGKKTSDDKLDVGTTFWSGRVLSSKRLSWIML